MKIQKILVPIDFSPCSLNALKIAAGIARQQNAAIEVVNAVHVPAHPHADVVAAGSLVRPLLAEYEQQVEDKFLALKEDLPELEGITFETRKFISFPTDAIHSCLEKDDIDLIVMGTKGSHDVLEKLIGGVTTDVIRFAKVPVLVIPENVQQLDIKTIGFATDLHQIEDIQKLEILSVLATSMDAEIKMFHIAQKDDVDHLAEIGKEKMKLLNSFETQNHSYVWVAEEQVTDGIFDFIDSHHLDMLAMYPRHHDVWDRIFKGSVTKKVVMRIEIPLLTIHE